MSHTNNKEVERIEEIVQIFQHEYGQYTSLGALSIASDWLRNTLHQQLQKAREEERERCIQAIKNPLTDWECIADLEDGDAYNHKTITVCRAVASINSIFKE